MSASTVQRQRTGFTQLGKNIGLLAVTLSIVIMAYAGLFGIAPILVFYAIWLPQIFMKGSAIAMPTRDTALYYLFCFYLILSTLWSDYRGVSLYTSLEYTSLMVCTVIMCRIVLYETWVKGVALGCFLTSLVALGSHNYASDPFSDSASLVGYFGSKNQVGLYAEVGILAAFTLYFFQKKLIGKIVFSAIPFLICAWALYACKSASSDISLVMTLCGMLVAYWISRLPQRLRGAAWMAAIAMVAVFAAIILITGLDELILKGFGKDSTLTGRTYLWGKGLHIGMRNPVLGDGYEAFWMVGRPEAEAFWYEFKIPARSGFHFHDLFIQVFVDLGFIGVIMMALILFGGFYKSARATIRYGMHLETAFPFAIMVMLLIRAIVEVDLIGTFAIGPVLLYSTMPMLTKFISAQQQAASAVPPEPAVQKPLLGVRPQYGSRSRPRRR